MYPTLLPSLAPEEVRQPSAIERILVATYNEVKRLPVLPLLLDLVGPSFSGVTCADGK
jgi:hypothetical protein